MSRVESLTKDGILALIAALTAVDISFTPVGGLAAANVSDALAELDDEKSDIGHTHASGAVAASAVTFSPTGSVASTDVQAAIAELDSEKATTSHSHTAAFEAVYTVPTSGSAQTIPDISVATVTYITLSANCTLTFPTAVAGESFTVVLKQDSTARTVTWPGTVKWPSGTAPTLTATAGKEDVFTFLCVDGTNFLGFVAGQAY